MADDVYAQVLGFARDDDAASVSTMITMGCPPTYANRVGQTSLHIGAMWGSIETVKVLLAARADPNQQNKLRGSTPLHAAVMGRGPLEKRIECVTLLVRAGGNPQLRDFDGELPVEACDDEALRAALGAAPLVLHKLVQSRAFKELSSALGRVECDIGVSDSRGETALHHATSEGWLEGVDALLRARANANALDNLQQTPLHKAVLRGDPRVVKTLIRARANVRVQDRDDEFDPRFKSSRLEGSPRQHRTPLHYAAQLGNVAVMRLLIEQDSAGVNIVDTHLQTPLHLSLALRGTDAEIVTGSGVRIDGLLTRPQWNGKTGAIIGPVVVSADGSPRWPVLVDVEGMDAVLLKADNLNLLSNEALNILLECGAEVNQGNHVIGMDRSILHEAAFRGDADLARCLLRTGRAGVDARCKSGFTALHIAARGRRIEIIKLLLDARADTSVRTMSELGGKTAADIARTNGVDVATIRLLGGASEGLAEVGSTPTVGYPSSTAKPQRLQDLTAEQRAALFVD